MEDYNIESVIARISTEYSVKLKMDRFSLVDTRNFEESYSFRAEYFKQKRGYPAKLFEDIVSSLKTVTNKRIGFLSLEINNNYSGFALVDIDRIIFYSGIITEEGPRVR